MATTKKDPVLVILQLTGANDYLNTIVPYTNGLYWDNRPKVNIPEHLVVPIDDELAFRSDMDSFKRSEEHTSELQSQAYLVCRLLLEKKNN